MLETLPSIFGASFGLGSWPKKDHFNRNGFSICARRHAMPIANFSPSLISSPKGLGLQPNLERSHPNPSPRHVGWTGSLGPKKSCHTLSYVAKSRAHNVLSPHIVCKFPLSWPWPCCSVVNPKRILRYVDSVTSLNRTPIFDWCVVHWGPKNKRHKDTCSKETGVRLQIFYYLLHTP